MITPVNKTKHAITPSPKRKTGYATWDDSTVTWNSNTLFWDSPLSQNSGNLAKHTITPINKAKS